MKKIIAIVVAMLMVVGLMLGCGSKDNQTITEEVAKESSQEVATSSEVVEATISSEECGELSTEVKVVLGTTESSAEKEKLYDPNKRKGVVAKSISNRFPTWAILKNI